MLQPFAQKLMPISIHSLRMEGDLRKDGNTVEYMIFQSTPSAWRETFAVYVSSASIANFNPLPPHGGRQHNNLIDRMTIAISIHSLRMEGDWIHLSREA